VRPLFDLCLPCGTLVVGRRCCLRRLTVSGSVHASTPTATTGAAGAGESLEERGAGGAGWPSRFAALGQPRRSGARRVDRGPPPCLCSARVGARPAAVPGCSVLVEIGPEGWTPTQQHPEFSPPFARSR
jgi:hypothetical protein